MSSVTMIAIRLCLLGYIIVVQGADNCAPGVCQDDRNTCSGSYVSGLCPGDAHQRCCMPASDNCAPGVCQDDRNTCSGSYLTGLCPGDAHQRCCMPDTQGCPGLTIVSRAEWGARAPRSVSLLVNPVSKVFIHHTDGSSCFSQSTCSSLVRGIQNYHMDTKGWDDIGYSFLVGEDGKVYEGRGWDRVGAHTQGYNSVSLAISFMGDYMQHNPGTAALNAAEAWLTCAVSKGMVTSSYKLYGHRDAGSTSCPGDSLYALIRTWSHYDPNGNL